MHMASAVCCSPLYDYPTNACAVAPLRTPNRPHMTPPPCTCRSSGMLLRLAREASPCSCAMVMPACLQRCVMVAASSSTNTPTAAAPPARAAAAMAAAVSSLTARLALGHIIMPAGRAAPLHHSGRLACTLQCSVSPGSRGVDMVKACRVCVCGGGGPFQARGGGGGGGDGVKSMLATVPRTACTHVA